MFYQKMFKLAAIALLVGCLASACNASAPPPGDGLVLVDEPFVEQKKGYTIRYPQGWTYQWKDYGDEVQFSEAGKADQQNFLPGPGVSIAVGSIEGFGIGSAGDARTILDSFLEGQMFNLNSTEEEGWVEKVENITVDGHDAAIATLKGTQDGTNFDVRFVFVHAGDRGAIILGVGQSEIWEAFNPTFESMVASMTFIEPVDE